MTSETGGTGVTVDYGSVVPVWKQVAAALREQILTGAIPPGRVLPSESQLEQDPGVARGTTRKAIALLRADGLVVTVAGRGSYVVSEAELRQHQRAQPE